MSITLEQAKMLRHGDVLHSEIQTNRDGSCQRWRVSGKVKGWKRNPDRIQVPLNHGLYSHDYLTNRDLDLMHLEGECPKKSK